MQVVLVNYMFIVIYRLFVNSFFPAAAASSNHTKNDPRMLILPNVPSCVYCGALKFYRETINFCCSAGQVSLASVVLPKYLVELLTLNDEASKDFHIMIRTYNNHFAYSTMSIHCDEKLEKRSRGIYTVRAQGQVHHFLNDLCPTDLASQTGGMHFYFYDPAEQIATRTSVLPRLRESTVAGLVKVMQPNPYSCFLKALSTFDNLDNYHIVIKADSMLDQRVYNLPTSSEVAGIWIESETDNGRQSIDRDIRVYARSGQSHNIQYYFSCYDPLQYVLMFPDGQPGWHGNIPTVGSILSGPLLNESSSSSAFDPMQITSFDDVVDEEIAGYDFNIFYCGHAFLVMLIS